MARRTCAVVAFCWLSLAGMAAAQDNISTNSSEVDPFGSLKSIPLSSDGSVKVSLGGQLRIRPELSDRPVFGLAKPEHNEAVLIRSLLSADFSLGPYLRSFVEVGSGQAPIWNGVPPATQLDRFDLMQGFGELTLPQELGALTFRAGRQEMSFGSSRLVSVRDSPNIRRTFDGVRVALANSPDTRIDAFFVRPVLPQHGVFDDKSDPGQAFWGVYATAPVPHLSPLKADYYYLGLDRADATFAQGTSAERRQTLGTRLFGKANNLDWNVEAAYQFGRFGNANIKAWSVSVELGYTFEGVPLSPRIGLNADAISGDRNLRDTTLQTFNPMFPRLPYFSEANLFAPANLIDVQPNLTVTPAKNVTLTIGWNPLWKESEADAFYGPAITPVAGTAGGAGRYVGQQVSTTLIWKPTRHLTFGGTYVNYTPGERIQHAGGTSGSFAATWATISF